jgi:hypothetical protein
MSNTITTSVSFRPDEDGYLGRECPQCERYFKVTLGTGLKGTSHCICPYCGKNAESNKFFTQDQVNYARSVALNDFSKAIVKELKRHEFTSRPRGPFGIGISLKVKGAEFQIEPYQERTLETEVVCDSCGLRYAVYGVFAYCPDCGVRNSLQVLTKSLAFAGKELDLSVSDTEHAERWIAEALENAVSAFDAFGRETCRVHEAAATDTAKAENVSFQSVAKAAENVRKLFAIDLESFVSPNEWRIILRLFQARHLIAHRAGVVDQQYIDLSGDKSAEVNRKLRIDSAEVRRLLHILTTLGNAFMQAFGSPGTPAGSLPAAPTQPSRQSGAGPQVHLPGNPFGLSNDAMSVAAALGKRDSDLSYDYVSDADISAETELNGLAFDAAIGELEDANLIETQRSGRRVFVKGTYDLPRALVRALDYEPSADDLLVADTLAAQGWLSGPELVDKTQLSIARLNRAVQRLKARNDIQVIQAIGTAPYRFRQLRATGETLRFVRSR